ncbi:MAG: zinc-binding dehydrogenase [Propionibacteriales bacterium]|nr:zinc-binding dehydrogenase [Propionibacteriales bacterium]
MKAVVHRKYGPPELLSVREVVTPQPAAGEILIRVLCSTVNRTDAGFLRAKPFITRFWSGLVRPKHTSLGCEFTGEVEAVGPDVTKFSVGERVFGFDDSRWGGHSEYKVIGEYKAVARVPDGVTDEQAASGTEGAHYALCNIRAAKVRPGHRVLVHGATGAIGSAAVQLLKHEGAYVVATSTHRNVDLVASLGADRVLDWEQEDFTACGERFDVVLDAVGKSSFGACRPLLVPGGVYVSTELGPRGQNLILGLVSPLLARTGAKRVVFPIPTYDQAMIEYLRDRITAGDFTPVIDRVVPLDEVAEAFRYVESGQKTGNVVLRVG